MAKLNDKQTPGRDVLIRALNKLIKALKYNDFTASDIKEHLSDFPRACHDIEQLFKPLEDEDGYISASARQAFQLRLTEMRDSGKKNLTPILFSTGLTEQEIEKEREGVNIQFLGVIDVKPAVDSKAKSTSSALQQLPPTGYLKIKENFPPATNLRKRKTQEDETTHLKQEKKNKKDPAVFNWSEKDIILSNFRGAVAKLYPLTNPTNQKYHSDFMEQAKSWQTRNLSPEELQIIKRVAVKVEIESSSATQSTSQLPTSGNQMTK